MGEPKPKALVALIVVLLAAIIYVKIGLNPMKDAIDAASRPQGEERTGEMMVQLPSQFIFASLAGFKEIVAGALWVRADSFFHMGEYQAIMPIVRMVTWLDPHNIDVYTTGAWHLDYNFVDENQMSDKRYIPASIALLKEGIRNNPKIWDLYFELGWTHYNKKLMDDDKALEYIKLACEREGFDINTGKASPRPEFVDRMLAHQYEKCGMLDEAIEQWHKSRKRIEEVIEGERKSGAAFADQSSLDVCDKNLALLLLRKAWRYGDMDAYKRGLEITKEFASRKHALVALKRAYAGSKADYERRVRENDPPRDALKPLDLGFEVSYKKVAPKVFIIRGKVNLIEASEYESLASESYTHWYEENQNRPAEKRELWRDGCRVVWKLTDYGYEMPDMEDFSFAIDQNQTVVWDTLYVSGGTFSDRIDLSRDPKFYPFQADKYRLTVWVIPQQPGCPDFVQDRVGWRGEAFTDKNHLDTTSRPGYKIAKWEKILDKGDIL